MQQITRKFFGKTNQTSGVHSKAERLSLTTQEIMCYKTTKD